MSMPPDSTTFGVQLFADANVTFMTLWKVMSVPPDSTTFCVQLFAGANVTVHDGLERSIRAT